MHRELDAADATAVATAGAAAAQDGQVRVNGNIFFPELP